MTTDPAAIAARLPHLGAFAQLVALDGSIESKLAFGIYMDAECRWAIGLNRDPTPDECAKYHEAGLMAHEIQKIKQESHQILSDYADALIRSHQKRYLQDAISDAIEAVHESRRSFLIGTLEAVAGAFVWTCMLIVLSIIAHLSGVDIIAVYEKLAGH